MKKISAIYFPITLSNFNFFASNFSHITNIRILIILFFVLSSSFLFSQDIASNSVEKQWVSALSLAENVFIENKGQFDGRNNSNRNTILYTVAKEGLEIHLTRNGLTYRYDESVELNKEEREREEEINPKKRNEGEEEHEKEFKTVSHFLDMNWVGSNPDVNVVVSDAATQYYTYAGNERSGNVSIQALAYKKLLYKNLYPNVDVEYTFPADKPGIKYTLILHPGADLSAIKMNYKNQKKIKLDRNGNIVIISGFGDFVDHAPISYDEQGKIISSAFELAGNIVSFKLNEPYNKKQKLTIDPWTTNPVIAGFNSAYDVDYDLKENVYVYGGIGSSRFRVHKFDKNGVLKWVHPLGIVATQPKYYGDFAVDASSQSVYIVEGPNAGGSRVEKLNALGNIVGVSFPSPQLTEMWRIAFNNCTKKAIIGGGGDGPDCQACVLDTNIKTGDTTKMTPVNILNTTATQRDVCLLALDNANDCYLSFARLGTFAGNQIIRCNGNTLAPSTTLIPYDNHDFAEVFNVAYVNNTAGNANGFNGIAVSNTNIYTYDGRLIQRWNKTTGARISFKNLTTTPYTWGGIAVDKCENIYVGVRNEVIKYDKDFNVIATISTQAAGNNVYDVKLGPKNKLYACGKGFVSSIDLAIPICNPLVIKHDTASLCGVFTASVTVTGGNPAYSYHWNPGGATTSSITGTTPGVYTVTVTDASGLCALPDTIIDTIRVAIHPGISLTTTASDAICGVVGYANVTASNGLPGYTYLWSTGQTTATATGLPPGLYSVTVTDSKGCTKTDTVTVFSSGYIVASVGPSNSVCSGNLLPLTLTVVGATNYIWSTGETTTTIYVTPSVTTTYSVIGTTNICRDTAEVTVTVNPNPLASLSGTNVCFNNPNVFTDKSVGNNTISTWKWDFGDGNTSTVQHPSHTYAGAGTYSVNLIITNNFGCKDTNNITVVVNPLPAVNFNSVPVCFRDTTCFMDLSTIPSGNITGWSWNFDDPISGTANISNIKNPCHVFNGPGPFNVILTVTSDSGCQSTVNHPATINLPPNALFTNSSVCLNSATNFTSHSTSSATDPINIFTWNFGDGTPNGSGATTTHIYTTAGTFTASLVVTTALGCKDTVEQPITVYGIPIANYTDPAEGCSPLCKTFKDLSIPPNGENIATWEWISPGGTTSSSTAQNPTFCWVTPGKYDLQLIITTEHGCKDTLFTPQYINVHAWPTADFCVVPNIAPSTEPVISLCDLWSSNVTSWSWDFGDNSTFDTTSTDPIHSYSATATSNDFYVFNICLRVQTQFGCWDTTCHPVELMPEFMFYIPNTFTPNKDGVNEMFFGKSRGVKDYNIWLFDRWGNLIWDCSHTGKNTDWDGPKQDGLSSYCQWNGKVINEGPDMNGASNQFAQEDVYVWKVKLTDIFDKQHTYIGHVNIVR